MKASLDGSSQVAARRVADDEFVSPTTAAKLAVGWIRNAVMPHGTKITEVSVEDDGGRHIVSWQSLAYRPDSNDVARTTACPWYGEFVVDRSWNVGELRRRVWGELFITSVRDIAHEIAEQLQVDGLCAAPHADDVSVAMGDLPAWEHGVVCDLDELAVRLF